MGKTFKDRRKFDRKNDRNDGLKEQKREPKRKHQPVLDEDDEPYTEYEND